MRFLGMARMGLVGEVGVEILGGKRAAEPGVIPEQKRKKDHQESEEGNEEIRFRSGAFGTGHESVIIALRWLVLLIVA